MGVLGEIKSWCSIVDKRDFLLRSEEDVDQLRPVADTGSCTSASNEEE